MTSPTTFSYSVVLKTLYSRSVDIRNSESIPFFLCCSELEYLYFDLVLYIQNATIGTDRETITAADNAAATVGRSNLCAIFLLHVCLCIYR